MHFNSSFSINKHEIGNNQPTYIVAEMSANHGNSLSKAIELVHAAKEAGADAIKLQTYTADTLTLNCKSQLFFINEGPWQGQYLHDLYQDASTPWEWHSVLKEEAEKIGIILFSSPFDSSSIDFLESLDVPAYKIASPELIDLPLIKQVALTGKPLILSTGNATLAQINAALQTAHSAGATNVCLLKCTSSYPALPSDINLKTIEHLQKSFSCPTGLSDHTLGIGVPIAAVALGACMIEKHFLLSKEDKSADSFFSLTFDELKSMVEAIRMAEKAIGSVNYPLQKKPSQRALFACKDILKGSIFTTENTKSLRPGGGIEPKHLEKVIGATAKQFIEFGTPLQWDMIG
ncbi:MAG: pseudaminic acid synthase [Methylococcales bacterium]|nr:pseudaminic acid synthase [Methylococcales bacterium]